MAKNTATAEASTSADAVIVPSGENTDPSEIAEVGFNVGVVDASAVAVFLAIMIP